MKRTLSIMIATLLLLTGCGGKKTDNIYHQISQEEARTMMDTQNTIILDVREQDGFDSGHISDAILLPVGTISKDTTAAVIPEMDSVVLVTAAAETAAKRLLRPWHNLIMSTFMSLAVLLHGPMR